MSSHVLELPLNIILNILSRLPIKTVFSCRCVCKKIHNLLSDRDYALQCLKRTPTTLLVRESPEYHLPRSFYSHAYLVDLEETNCNIRHQYYPFEALNKYKIYRLPEFDRLELVGSCNGLLCLYQPERYVYYVCNPLLGEYIVLPSPSIIPLDYMYLNYFGFCPKTNQYKVIRVVSNSRRKMVVEVHTIGTKSWTNIGDVPWPLSHRRGSFEPFLNGVLHLIVDGGTSSHLICSFDTEKERFRPVPPPPHFDSDYMKNVTWINVGVYEGSLCICYVYAKSHFEVWVMNEYGVKESWTKKFVVDYNKCQMHVGDKGHPLVFMENGEMWMMYTCLYLYKYSLQYGTVRVLDICGLDESFEAIAYVPSFVSLKDALMGSDLKVEKC